MKYAISHQGDPADERAVLGGVPIILAQGVARLLGEKPVAANGFTYVAAADFYAISSVLRTVSYLSPSDFYNNVLQQVTMLFGRISAGNAGGNPADLENDPAVGCRIACLNTGIFGGNVLPCACADLALLSAFSDSAEPDNLLLQLIFDQPVDPASVTDLYNFKFQSTDASATLPKVLSAANGQMARGRPCTAAGPGIHRHGPGHRLGWRFDAR